MYSVRMNKGLNSQKAGQGARWDDGLSSHADDQAVRVLGGGGGVRAVVVFVASWVMVVLGQFLTRHLVVSRDFHRTSTMATMAEWSPRA